MRVWKAGSAGSDTGERERREADVLCYYKTNRTHHAVPLKDVPLRGLHLYLHPVREEEEAESWPVSYHLSMYCCLPLGESSF